jgi:hypothetical protein
VHAVQQEFMGKKADAFIHDAPPVPDRLFVTHKPIVVQPCAVPMSAKYVSYDRPSWTGDGSVKDEVAEMNVQKELMKSMANL